MDIPVAPSLTLSDNSSPTTPRQDALSQELAERKRAARAAFVWLVSEVGTERLAEWLRVATDVCQRCGHPSARGSIRSCDHCEE